MIEHPYGKFIENGSALKFSPETIEAARNHPSAKHTRRMMMNDQKPSSCNLCWNEEAIGITSKRMTMLRHYPMDAMLARTAADGAIEDIPIAYVDLRLGNLCNLKCRTCSPTDSSMWIEDYAELHKEGDKAALNYYGSQTYDIIKSNAGWDIDSTDFDWYDSPVFHRWLDNLLQNGLNRFYFTGGEPTINKNHMRVLGRIIELGRAHDVILEYNSNMVAIPPKLLAYWPKFKEVHIGISIDAIGALAYYVRHPSRWSAIERNCDAIGYGQIPVISASLATTISVLNVRHFLDLSRWLVCKFYKTIEKYPTWHLLHYPAYLSIQVLPDDIKHVIVDEYESFYRWIGMNFGDIEAQQVREMFSPIIRYMMAQSSIHLLPTLKARTEELDNLRNENLETHLPWLADILKARS